ncbi:MAG: AAA family ATPase [Methanospirillaceae archaeon]|nr:AAA family ATPase [Methanospirillaceae archaeon]
MDKIRYIRVLENCSASYQFFFRSGRFRKSLFFPVLNYYYNIYEKGIFYALFNGTYFGNKPPEKRNSYYVRNYTTRPPKKPYMTLGGCARTILP